MKLWKLLGVLCLSFGASAQAAIVSGTWSFSATYNSVEYSGTFSFTALDTSVTVLESTGSGFSVTTNFDTTGNGGHAFDYIAVGGGQLSIFGLIGGSGSSTGPDNDWLLLVESPPFGPGLVSSSFQYFPASGEAVDAYATVGAVPEPSTYALMLAGLGLLGFMARRPRH